MAPKEKRRLDDEDLHPPAKGRPGGSNQLEKLSSTLAALNSQFASWVATQKELNPHMFWLEGVRDYVKHATKVLDEFKDLLPTEGVHALKKAATEAEDRSTSSNGPTPASTGFGLAGVSGGGSFFGVPSTQPANKSAAPATGFMAPPAATTTTTAPSSSAPSSLFGTSAAITIGATTGTLSFGVPTTATTGPAANASGAQDTAAGTTEAAAKAPSAPKSAVSFMFGSAAPTADKDTAAGSKDGASADATATCNGNSAAGGGGGSYFKFGVKNSSASNAGAGGEATGTGSSPDGADAAAASAPKSTFTFGSGNGAFGSAPSAGTSASIAPPPSTSSGFFFGVAPATTSAPSTSAPAPATLGSIFGSSSTGTGSGFTFGAAPDSAANKSGDAAGAGSTAAGGFSFGAPVGGGFGASGSDFSFGATKTGFSFGAGPAAGNAAGGGGDEDDNEPEPEPDEFAKEPSLKVDDSVEFLFKEKARLQVPTRGDDGKITGWSVRGLGFLSVRRAKKEGSKPYVALVTETGKCLYQAYIFPSMKLVVSDKTKTVSFSAVWSPDGSSPPALHPALFQLAQGKNRAFETIVNRLIEEMK